MSPLAYLCPACGNPVGMRGRCATCKRDDERQRYATSPQRQLRSSRRYQRQPAAAKARDGYRCVNCGASDNLEAHHIAPLEQGGDPFALDNLVTLCVDCHRRQPAFFATGSNTRPPTVRGLYGFRTRGVGERCRGRPRSLRRSGEGGTRRRSR